MKQGIPWKKYTVEGFVIVASILLAFAIDAWWDTRNEYAEEQTALIDLRNELQENLSAIESTWLNRLSGPLYGSVALFRHLYGLPLDGSVIELSRSRISAGENLTTELYNFYRNEVLVPISDANLSSSPIEVRAGTVEIIRLAPTYGPSIASLDVLFQSGMVNRIQNEELRSKLAAMPLEINDYNYEEGVLTDFVLNNLRNLLETSVSESREIALLSVGMSNTEARSKLQNTLIQVTPSEKLVYALSEKIDYNLRVLGQLDVLITRYEEIVEMIDVD